MNSGSCKNCSCANRIYIIGMYKEDLAVNNLQ